MRAIKNWKKILTVGAVAACAVGLAAPAQASPVPPKADASLYGTWVNLNSATRGVKQVVIGRTLVGGATVDAFGACVPTLCEWGRVPAIVYGANVSSPTGATFQSNQRFLSAGKEWSRITLTGRVVKTPIGLRLTLRHFTTFSDGSGRKNYSTAETFRLGEGPRPTKNGYSVASYVRGLPPFLTAGALGNWKNPAPSGGLVKIRIAGTTLFPTVQAFGQCSPTPCNWGIVRGITFGTSISSPVGASMIAPYTFSFKKAQLVLSYTRLSTGAERLTVTTYNEFTDGSGRSNYIKTESFVRA